MTSNIIKLALFLSASLVYSQGIDTQNRDNAGAFGASIKSGFYQTSNPINFPTVAQPTEWWHLLDIRHTEPSNNFAMQFSGSFFNQDLYFRKTNDLATRAWNKILMENAEGKVAVGKGNIDVEKFTLNGSHDTTTFLMHADNAALPHGYLTLWASEPLVTYTGIGIGNNVRNNFNGQAFSRINTSQGGAYIRLLENLVKVSVISGSGINKDVVSVEPSGMTIEGNLVSNRSISEGGSVTLINSSKTGVQNNNWSLYNMTGPYGNSLQFWGYAADGSNSGVRLKISDTGDMALPHGKFEAKEVKVTTSPTADFVFEENYELPTLEAVEKHIKEKKHLPEIASAKEMEKDGVNIGEFQIKLLQKIEELTLYSIEQNKKIVTLQSENKDLKSLLERVEKLEKSAKN